MRRGDGKHRQATPRAVPRPLAEYASGPQRTRQFTRKGHAERFLDAIRGDLTRGIYVDPAGGRTLFGDYAEEWRAGQVRPRPHAGCSGDRRASRLLRQTPVTREQRLLRSVHDPDRFGPASSAVRSGIYAWVRAMISR